MLYALQKFWHGLPEDGEIIALKYTNYVKDCTHKL